jgi:hypothetical protein
MTDTRVHPWMVHPHTGEPLRSLGAKRDGDPIWPIMGASEDDDADEDEDADEDDPEGTDDEDETDDPDKDKTPEEIKAELQRLRASRRKDIKRIRRMRERAKDGTKKPGDDDPDKKFTRTELDEIRTETETATRGEMLPVVIKYAATSALRDAGFDFPDDKDARAAKLKRALKLMDVEDVEVDDEGEVLGLEDAIDELKAEFPELFAKAGGTRQRKRPGNIGGTGKPVARKKSLTELQAEALFGAKS